MENVGFNQFQTGSCLLQHNRGFSFVIVIFMQIIFLDKKRKKCYSHFFQKGGGGVKLKKREKIFPKFAYKINEGGVWRFDSFTLFFFPWERSSNFLRSSENFRSFCAFSDFLNIYFGVNIYFKIFLCALPYNQSQFKKSYLMGRIPDRKKTGGGAQVKSWGKRLWFSTRRFSANLEVSFAVFENGSITAWLEIYIWQFIKKVSPVIISWDGDDLHWCIRPNCPSFPINSVSPNCENRKMTVLISWRVPAISSTVFSWIGTEPKN